MISRLFLLLCLATAWGVCVPWRAVARAEGTSGHTLHLTLGAGEIAYEEDVSIDPVDSEWTSDYIRFDAAWTHALSPRLAVRVDGFLWVANDATETWSSGGAEIQVNDLEAQEFGLRGSCGYDLLPRVAGVDLTGWLGLGLRYQDFDRSRFVLYEEGNPSESLDGSVGETYDLVYLSLGLEGWFDITHELRGGVSVAGGPFIYNEADNEALGGIEGSGGYLLQGRVSVEWTLHPRHAVVISALYDLQSLEGGVVKGAGGMAEWPDNTTELFGIELGWAYRM